VIEAHYSHGAFNPLFREAGEKPITPVHPRTIDHNGASCGPKERVIQVARYGRVYKRKVPWQNFCALKKLTPPGMRYCKFCEAFLPLSAFYTHIARFVCRYHHRTRVRSTELKRWERDPTRGIATEMWFALADVRHYLGYYHVNFDYMDMRALVIHCGIPFSMRPRVLPIDPSLPLRPRNVAIVTKRCFDLIIQTYTSMCSRALFIAQVA